MSKILEATANALGIVTADGVPIVGVVVLSAGKQASSGVAVLDGDKVWYLTSNATDIKTTIEKVNEALTKVATALTSIGANMTGPTTSPPPTLAADVLEITAKVLELTLLKENLK